MITQGNLPRCVSRIANSYLGMLNKFIIELISMPNYIAHNIRYFIYINEQKLPLSMHILTNWKHMIATFPSLKKLPTGVAQSYFLVIVQCVDQWLYKFCMYNQFAQILHEVCVLSLIHNRSVISVPSIPDLWSWYSPYGANLHWQNLLRT